MGRRQRPESFFVGARPDRGGKLPQHGARGRDDDDGGRLRRRRNVARLLQRRVDPARVVGQGQGFDVRVPHLGVGQVQGRQHLLARLIVFERASHPADAQRCAKSLAPR